MSAVRKITIKDTKNIKHFEFTIPERNDVYLLVGANGAGKTTLLICLDRICNPLAFARGFASARNFDEVDQYENASIQYETDDVLVKFRKKTAKWAPSPKKGSKELLEMFGYPAVVFIKADSKRIDITQEEMRQGDYVNVAPNIKIDLNTIFETNKFSRLKCLRNRNGRGRQATIFYVIKDGEHYYSEKRFSSGELALLRLVEKIQSVPDGALILLDEAEMALHPRVQKNLHTYLKQKSVEKNLMLILATHSSSLIKITSKSNIILLQQERNNHIKAITPCYPATAIGSVDFESNTIFDYIFFVEDDMARMLMKRMFYKYLDLEPIHATAMSSIIPVGGYQQTATLAVNTRHQLFEQSKVFAVLDEDAFVEGQANQVFWTLYENNNNIIYSLGCTPELWIVERLENNDQQIELLLRQYFHCEFQTILQDDAYRNCNARNLRKRAKSKKQGGYFSGYFAPTFW